MSIQYVVGFLFSEDRKRVALIRKKRPAWQAGKLNGIGGHVEDGETAEDAMIREFREETGITIDSWEQYATMLGRDWTCDVFAAFSDDIVMVETVTDEEVETVSVDYLPLDVIKNLNWLIPMALDEEVTKTRQYIFYV